MIKSWIRKWLGVDDDFKKNAADVSFLSGYIDKKIGLFRVELDSLRGKNSHSERVRLDTMFNEYILALADHAGVDFKTIQVSDPCAIPYHTPTIDRVICVKKSKK